MTEIDTSLQLGSELRSFQNIWKGGYFEGNPKDPHGPSSYAAIDVRHGYADQADVMSKKGITAQQIGTISVLYATWLLTLQGRVKAKTVLEIGPGRGGWTKAILEEGAEKVYALDALPAEHNQFFEYLGPDLGQRSKYIQVSNFLCAGVPDDSVDVVFSFGCFCHISRIGVTEYMKSIYLKMREGSEGCIMNSDYAKIASCLGSAVPADLDREDATPSPGRWYHLGVGWFVELLSQIGFTILSEDIGCCPRDPIVHFAKPVASSGQLV